MFVRLPLLFGDELDIVGAGVNELELEGAGETFVKGEWGIEAGGVGFLGFEFCCDAELLDADGGNNLSDSPFDLV